MMAMSHRYDRQIGDIPEDALTFRFVRSSGPGGQNVNKVATAVQLRVDLNRAGLPAPVRARLERIAPSQVNQHGELVIAAHRFRSQHLNRQDALERLAALIAQARRAPKKRLATAPSKAQKHKRREEKRLRSAQKKLRTRHRLHHGEA